MSYTNYRNNSGKTPTHRGMLVKRDKEGNVIEQHRVSLLEHKATYQDTLFWNFWSKENGRRRPMTAIMPWKLEGVLTIDEARCIEHDNITFLNDVE